MAAFTSLKCQTFKPVRIFASSESSKTNWDKVQERLNNRRNILERSRQVSLKGIQEQLVSIGKREVEFAKNIAKEEFSELDKLRKFFGSDSKTSSEQSVTIEQPYFDKDEVIDETFGETSK
jgi:hypothetical protein